MMRRLLARWRCHRSLWCCQYVDDPQCNSPYDPHWLAVWWRFQRPLDPDRRIARGTLKALRRDWREREVA